MANFCGEFEVLETLYRSEHTTVTRARRRSDGETVVLKCLAAVEPRPRDLLRFRRELEIAEALQGDRFIGLQGSFEDQDLRCVVLEDFGGESLDRTLKRRRFDIDEFLCIAIELTAAVGRLHEQGIIHRDINPSNIVWNSSTGEVKLIDFGISTSRKGEQLVATSPEMTAATLAYMSPEQTGRTNWRVDYRSDYYSLGVTLYELLTGRLPFQAQDRGEIIHAHLAKTPAPPDQRRGDVPFQLSAVIMRLLAKSADDRYQSARGLKADLQQCLQQWRHGETIEEFDLGQEDVRTTLQISQRLYGRRREMERLKGCVEEVATGRRWLTLIRGEAGIGKTALLDALGRFATEKKAWSAKGKFDPAGHTEPYSAFAQALGQLIELLLGRSESELAMWRRRMESALEDDRHLVASVVPGLRRILGPQPSVDSEVELSEAKHRFLRAIRRFLCLFCGPDRPLVILLDDLQWADHASLKLIEWLVSDEDTGHLFIVGSFRPEEVTEDHPLMAMVDRLRQQSEQAVETMTLGALSEEDVCCLVADSLEIRREAATPLAKWLRKKTGGNPFFIHQMLQNLSRDGTLWFDADAGHWRWDESQLASLPATVNVVEHLSAYIAGLEEKTRQLLRIAALLGTRFSLQHLVMASGLDPKKAYGDLQPALEQGILVAFEAPKLWDPEDLDSPLVVHELGFSHDRVRQAALTLWEHDELVAAHLRLGRLLQERYREDSSLLFSVVAHLNAAHNLLTSDEERRELARLNLKAARQALEASASDRAVELLTVGQKLLEDGDSTKKTELWRQLMLARSRAELLAGHLEQAQAIIDQVLSWIKDPLWRAEFALLLIEKYSLQLDMEPAIEVGVETLRKLGVELTVTGDLDQALMATFAEIEDRLAGRSAEEALGAIGARDERLDAALRVLSALQAAAALIDARLFNLMGLKVTALSLTVGVRPATPKGLVVYGGALCLLGEPHRGYEAGELALRLAKNFANKADLAHVEVVFAAMDSPPAP